MADHANKYIPNPAGLKTVGEDTSTYVPPARLAALKAKAEAERANSRKQGSPNSAEHYPSIVSATVAVAKTASVWHKDGRTMVEKADTDASAPVDGAASRTAAAGTSVPFTREPPKTTAADTPAPVTQAPSKTPSPFAKVAARSKGPSTGALAQKSPKKKLILRKAKS